MLKTRVFSTLISETREYVSFYFMVGFPLSFCSHTIFLWCDEKSTLEAAIGVALEKKVFLKITKVKVAGLMSATLLK